MRLKSQESELEPIVSLTMGLDFQLPLIRLLLGSLRNLRQKGKARRDKQEQTHEMNENHNRKIEGLTPVMRYTCEFKAEGEHFNDQNTATEEQ